MEIAETKKLGNTLENLTNAVKNKDIESALKAFKLIKENKYSVFIEKNKSIDKENYNSKILEDSNKINYDLSI